MEWDREYTYHVVLAGQVIGKSRNAGEARELAQKHRAQFWRTPIGKEYPAVLLCEFREECWQKPCARILARLY
jgi:hypothetical protein